MPSVLPVTSCSSRPAGSLPRRCVPVVAPRFKGISGEQMKDKHHRRAKQSPAPNEAEVDAARCRESDPSDRPPKMRFIHQRRELQKGAVVQLDCDTQCNFMLLSDRDYVAYQQVRRFRYHGGTFKRFPARITVPETGPWNIIIDLAGANREIQYNITVVIE